jgi:hypothetical protein
VNGSTPSALHHERFTSLPVLPILTDLGMIRNHFQPQMWIQSRHIAQSVRHNGPPDFSNLENSRYPREISHNYSSTSTSLHSNMPSLLSSDTIFHHVPRNSGIPAQLVWDEKIDDHKPWLVANDGLVVEDPTTITSSYPELQFNAAASGQIACLSGNRQSHKPSTFLITSPYNLLAHWLDLRRLPNVQDQLLAMALAFLKPIVADYATLEYESAFNWNEVFTVLRSLSPMSGTAWTTKEFYVVVFRSILKDNIDMDLLSQLDRESHREAVQSGGLLKYWFGKCSSARKNLATCGYTVSLFVKEGYTDLVMRHLARPTRRHSWRKWAVARQSSCSWRQTVRFDQVFDLEASGSRRRTPV